MAAAVQTVLAKILIQVGADEPKEIGTIEIPIEIRVPMKASAAYATATYADGENLREGDVAWAKEDPRA